MNPEQSGLAPWSKKGEVEIAFCLRLGASATHGGRGTNVATNSNFCERYQIKTKRKSQTILRTQTAEKKQNYSSMLKT